MVSTEGVKVQARGICIFILPSTDSNCGNGLEGCSFVNFSGRAPAWTSLAPEPRRRPPRRTGRAAGHAGGGGPLCLGHSPASWSLRRRHRLWSEHLFWGD